jgi:ABC-2 type transport system ATP-binding protein
MPRDVIVTENLCKSYGSKEAVRNMCIRVESEVFGFIGPNGAGKTTTIAMLIGLIKPSRGKAYVLGHDILSEMRQIKQKTGYLPEDPRLYFEMSGRSFLKFIARIRGVSSQNSYVDGLLREVDLLGDSEDKIATYSRGMITRLGLAMALVGDPELLLLDEPTAHLDPLAREQVLDLIRQQRKQGKNFFISSHILSELEKVCDDVAIIDSGRVLLQGELQELKKRYSENRYVVETSRAEDFLRSIQPLACVASAWKEGNSVVVIPKDEHELRNCVMRIAYENGHEISRFERVTPSLQDLFVSLIKEKRGAPDN